MTVRIIVLFVLFMAVLVLVMVVTLILLLRPRRSQRGFQVIVKPGEQSGTRSTDEGKS